MQKMAFCFDYTRSCCRRWYFFRCPHKISCATTIATAAASQFNYFIIRAHNNASSAGFDMARKPSNEWKNALRAHQKLPNDQISNESPVHGSEKVKLNFNLSNLHHKH